MKYVLVTFSVLAWLLVAFVLFQYPQPGVADQGDFYRVMSPSGLELTEENQNDPDFKRYFDYIVTDYKISHVSAIKVLGRITATSIAYLITFISFICKVCAQDIFKTTYLAIVYGVLYIFSFFVIFKYINIKSKISLIIFVLLSLFIFFDGNYLVWFNSLYGEPMMITALMLYISAWIYYIYHKDVARSHKNIFAKIIFIFISATLFLGSKMQVITSLPIILFMLGRLLLENRPLLKRTQFRVLCIFYFILLLYPTQINLVHRSIGKDTQYNSVFYGVLKDSKSPRQDLIDLGLNPDMAVEAGKHSYLASEKYIRYVPNTEITEREFYSKMGNAKLIKLYITHPVRLMQGMEYSAKRSFFTGTSLGKYKRSYSEEPIRRFDRFTTWSSIKERIFPKKLIFILIVCSFILAFSLVTYMRSRDDHEIRAKIQLLWMIILIGLIQFPMPFVANGQADTSKQLFLFNFVFDIMLVVSVWWVLNMLLSVIYLRKSK